MTENNDFITWSDGDERGKAEAFSQFSDVSDAYSGIGKSHASHRDFTDIETNISVRSGFGYPDYYAFRSHEQIPQRQKRIIKMCMNAYDKVGIIRNVIDLMGDFGQQGINLVHQNKSVEKFYRNWFKKVNGKERSERFLNILYRTGNVIIYKSFANMTPELIKFMKTVANDIKVETPDIENNVIPWRYNFFNPMSVNLKDGGLSLFLGKKNLTISSSSLLDKFKDNSIPPHVLDTLPPKIKRSIERGEKEIPLDPDRVSTFYYKKDDWSQWANPMIYAILDDVMMLEKMRLADLSALDGAISNIRLWTIGNLDHKILPNKSAINKLREILSNNVGGGTMELVWGPELSFTESSSDVYKFLGSEKYQAVLNSIYAGLGVPPTLTGMAGQSGGFTNNFISLKTLVERLQYGRDMLIKFWQHEVELVRRAMGFRYPAQIHFDQMSLSDEAAEKNLLIQLADRDIISHETVLERFKEIPTIEKIRLKRELQDRERESSPDKAGPFHNAQHQNDLEKIALQQGVVTPEDVGLESSLDSKDMIDRKFPKPQPAGPSGPSGPPKKKKSEKPDGGRPRFSTDKDPRKKRVDKPRSKPGLAELIAWSQNSLGEISDIVNEAFLSVKGKKNLRQLTKSDVAELENLKLDVLTNSDVNSEITPDIVYQSMASNLRMPQDFKELLEISGVNTDNMSIDSYRQHVIGVFVEYKLSR
ncbi:MAG: hypothetical protein FI729_01800 [SAR202 cluster bacterium]|jgi:hypothetical protein|nr:hypothetical protein [SAR202 cluster bacterium]|tara:strand:+ start:7775 stop:9883 length:2109 start_codon:yes stop_codon:yes gene_type:complete